MEYNTSRPKLIISEYGRNIQKLTDYISGLKDKKMRNEMANAVIEMMAQANPQHRHNEEFRHKLWDHLFVISNYKLDVDAPFPKPKEQLTTKPGKAIPYPQGKIRFKHYGKNIELMIEKAKSMTDENKKKAFMKIIANYMKMASANWNKENKNDDVIIDDLKLISDGALILDKNVRLQTVSIPRTNNSITRRRNPSNRKRPPYNPRSRRN